MKVILKTVHMREASNPFMNIVTSARRNHLSYQDSDVCHVLLKIEGEELQISQALTDTPNPVKTLSTMSIRRRPMGTRS